MGRGGFTYAGLLVVIVIMGITSMVVAQTWKSVSRIEKERELIWRGHQIRNAIKGYYEYRKAGRGGVPGDYYPTDLKDLVSDPGRLGAVSWLRKVYDDPMTGKPDWVLIRTAGGIKGVKSNSDEEPLKKAGFDVDDSSFTLKTKYSEWEFVYPPVITYTAAPVPGYLTAIGGPASGAGGGWGAGGWGSGDWGGGGWGGGGSTGWPAQQAPPPPPAQAGQDEELDEEYDEDEDW